ncbi:hypothetical protein JHL21_01060 [Devosia sp. WQ 349]|uniref:hypothetical protein n=1 Tax=Devosia sp. WQ 349K1 TaxID=2800329 RepID=UPI0019082139|nr:hypothetical protein [Devosia sp. WQ 349K1]MBK1793084.1 hypothetical protein [Devosia sp. WQ 349K1]
MSALYFLLASTAEALSSNLEPVCLLVPAWERADPAKLFAVAEEFGFAKIAPAFDPTLLEVCFLLLIEFPAYTASKTDSIVHHLFGVNNFLVIGQTSKKGRAFLPSLKSTTLDKSA